MLPQTSVFSPVPGDSYRQQFCREGFCDGRLCAFASLRLCVVVVRAWAVTNDPPGPTFRAFFPRGATLCIVRPEHQGETYAIDRTMQRMAPPPHANRFPTRIPCAMDLRHLRALLRWMAIENSKLRIENLPLSLCLQTVSPVDGNDCAIDI